MRTLLLLAVGVLAVSMAGPLMALIAVPPLAIAFWRNAMATGILAGGVLGSRRAELVTLGPGRLLLVLGAGLALAVHFATWVPALTMTSVASATALVSLQIGWVVAWQVVRGVRFSVAAVVGLLAAFAGVLVVSGVDLTLSARHLTGDVLALFGGMAAAAYTVIGSRARRAVSTTTYTFLCYGSCALLLLLACLVAGQPVWGYDARQWLLLALVTLTAQLMGHSVFNHLLVTTGPVVVSLALLLEVPGAALLAALLLGQRPSAAALAGLCLILAGMALVVVGTRGGGAEPALEAPVD